MLESEGLLTSGDDSGERECSKNMIGAKSPAPEVSRRGANARLEGGEDRRASRSKTGRRHLCSWRLASRKIPARDEAKSPRETKERAHLRPGRQARESSKLGDAIRAPMRLETCSVAGLLVRYVRNDVEQPQDKLPAPAEQGAVAVAEQRRAGQETHLDAARKSRCGSYPWPRRSALGDAHSYARRMMANTTPTITTTTANHMRR